MEYLIAVETLEIWNISNRMIAYYCETGRAFLMGGQYAGKNRMVTLSHIAE